MSIKQECDAAGYGANILAAGLTGLMVGFAGSFVDAMVSSQMGRTGSILPEVATAILVLVPLGCLGGMVLGGMLPLLGRIHPKAQAAVTAMFPYAWVFSVFVYIAVSYYRGLGAFYFVYAKCALAALLLGVPTYVLLRLLWLSLCRASVRVMVLVASIVGVGAALVEIGVYWSGFWSR